MDENDIRLKLNDHDHQIQDLEDRVNTLSSLQNETHAMALSIQKLADNMQHMIQEQKAQGVRLERLEQEPIEKMKWYRRTILAAVITAIVGALVGMVLGHLL